MKPKDENALRDACLKFDGDAVIEWVKENYNPSDLFNERQIEEHVREYWDPDGIFDEKALAEWARLNGYVKEGGAP